MHIDFIIQKLVKDLVKGFFNYLMITSFLVMVLFSVFGCKEGTQKHVVTNTVTAHTPSDMTASLQAIHDQIEATITTYQANNKVISEESVEFNNLLTKVKALDVQTLQSAVAVHAFSNASDKLDTLAQSLAADPGANKNKVNSTIHNIGMFTVALGGLSALAYAHNSVKNYSLLTKGELTGSMLRGGLNLGAAIVAGFVLSQDAQPSDGVVIALGVLLGTRAADQLGQALSKLNASNEAVTAMVQQSIRKDLMNQKFKGDVFAESDKLYKSLSSDKLAALQSSVETRMKWGGIGGLVGSGIVAYVTMETFMGLTATPEETVLHSLSGAYQKLCDLEKPLRLSLGN